MTAIVERIPELSDETQAVIRFFIKDQAFSTEFLVTAIQEYYLSNSDEVRQELALEKLKVSKTVFSIK